MKFKTLYLKESDTIKFVLLGYKNDTEEAPDCYLVKQIHYDYINGMEFLGEEHLIKKDKVEFREGR